MARRFEVLIESTGVEFLRVEFFGELQRGIQGDKSIVKLNGAGRLKGRVGFLLQLLEFRKEGTLRKAEEFLVRSREEQNRAKAASPWPGPYRKGRGLAWWKRQNRGCLQEEEWTCPEQSRTELEAPEGLKASPSCESPH